jgi:TRAP-type transport system small permease protein
MSHIGDIYLKFIDKMNKTISLLLGAMLSVMVIIIFSQVFSRFVLKDSISWSEELARFIMVWGVLLGAGYATRKGELIAVEVLAEYSPPKMKVVLGLLVHLLTIIFCAYLFYYGVIMALKVQMQTSPALGLSMLVPYASIPVGSAVIFLNTVASMIETFNKNGGAR